MGRNVCPKHAAQRSTDGDKAVETLALLDGKQIGHECPKDGRIEQIEDADPDVQGSTDPDLLRGRARPHENEEEHEIENEKSVGERDKLSPRHTRDYGREEGIGDQHRHECGTEHPRQRFQSVPGGDAVANRPHNVVAGENQKMKNEPEPERANLVRLYVNNLGENAFHIKSAVIPSASEGSRLLA